MKLNFQSMLANQLRVNSSQTSSDSFTRQIRSPRPLKYGGSGGSIQASIISGSQKSPQRPIDGVALLKQKGKTESKKERGEGRRITYNE